MIDLKFFLSYLIGGIAAYLNEHVGFIASLAFTIVMAAVIGYLDYRKII